MKKLLTLALAFLSVGFVASAVEAKSTDSPVTTMTANAVPGAQVRIRLGSNRRRNRRVVRTTRVSRNGRRIVTRTYRTNGRRTVIRQRTIRRRY